jgi:hypothetical protein
MRDERLELTVTSAERALLRETAQREGLPLAAWMRMALLRAARLAEAKKEPS